MNLRRRRAEKGFVTIEFVLGVAFLLLPVTLLVLVLPTWSEYQSVARVAAREAARSYVISNNIEQSREVALRIADNGKIDRTQMTVELTGDPTARGTSVRATVSLQIPGTFIPILDNQTDGFELVETHAEVVDRYRSAQ